MKTLPFRILAFAAFCIFLAGMAWYAARWLDTLPGRALLEAHKTLNEQARHLRDGFAAIGHFQPEIRINNRVVFQKQTEIAELSVLSRETQVSREFEHTWAGSTKKLHLQGRFLVKSGFDLREPAVIVIRKDHTEIFLPEPRILSVELINLDLQKEDGWWNQITDAEQKSEIEALRQLARQRSVDLNLEAGETFRRRLGEMAGPKTEIHLGSPAPDLPK